ncbi:polysaccharide deacetylase family protein [Lysobacter enzymogenes]|jgi:peptidoglycan/xylan/chitin deacetylase (PgdA/CDA1 family)|uniref:polysaccharide deacetylase family protein n=1 Tax=Lysobacter enzymogenes TaxID=69 RepID=UPI00089C0FEE|nr:polysaccharide deacetylase family protein [Lysobacter enzymogenes]SDX38684.1 Polysaccharide deacetylase [Lysobacter enzymogenes]
MRSDSAAGNAVILMYHRIADAGTDLCVSPAEFREQMAALRAQGCRVMPLLELAQALARGDAPERSVAITLDDGYLDALTDAAPILREFDYPATFFIVTSTLDGPGEFWWESLQRVADHEALPATLDVALGEGAAPMPLDTPERRRAAFDAVRRGFYPLSAQQRRERIAELLRWSGLAAAGEAGQVRAMTAEELRRLDAMPGMELGAHSENHLLLPAHPRAVKEHEMLECRRKLETLLGREVLSFCYPYGAFDEDAVQVAERAGFAAAVTTGNQPASPLSHRLVLPRLAVHAGDDLGARLRDAFAAQAQPHHYDRSFA